MHIYIYAHMHIYIYAQTQADRQRRFASFANRLAQATSEAESVLRTMGDHSDSEGGAVALPTMRTGSGSPLTTSSADTSNRILEQSQSTERQEQSPRQSTEVQDKMLRTGQDDSDTAMYTHKTRIPLNITFSSSFASSRTTLPSGSPLREYDVTSTPTASPSREYAAAWTPSHSGSPLREYRDDSILTATQSQNRYFRDAVSSTPNTTMMTDPYDASLRYHHHDELGDHGTTQRQSAPERVPLIISPSPARDTPGTLASTSRSSRPLSEAQSPGHTMSRYLEEASESTDSEINRMAPPASPPQPRPESCAPRHNVRLPVPCNTPTSVHNKPAPQLMSPPQFGQKTGFPHPHRFYVPQSQASSVTSQASWQQQPRADTMIDMAPGPSELTPGRPSFQPRIRPFSQFQ